MESPKKTATTREVFGVYVRQIREHKTLFALVLLSIFGMQGADLFAPLYLKKFSNILTAHWDDPQVAANTLTHLIALIAIIWLCSWAFSRLKAFGTICLEIRTLERLYNVGFGYLLGHSHQFFASNFSGALTFRIQKFSRSFESLFDSIFDSLFPTFLFVIGVIVVLFLRDHMLGLVLAVWSVCFVLFQIYISRVRQPIRLARSDADTAMTAAFSDAIANQSTVQLFAHEPHERSRVAGVVAIWRKAAFKAWGTDSIVWGVLLLFNIAIEVAALCIVASLWRKGLFTVGDFVLIQAYLFVLFDRLSNISQQLKHVYDAIADASEMVAILNEPHGVQDIRGAKPLAVSAGEIVFKDVDFYFHETRQVLRHFNMTVRAGERVALVGQSGAGKSTITKLLLRLYDVAGGEVAIDGQNIARVTQESLRRAVAFVPQEPVLFHRTLMDNIRYGRLDATDEEVIEAARLAHCHEFIEALPEQYGTYVGERGIKLSGGERQRVAIARAILKNAPILVLDEATSSLDSESEALIQDALRTLMQGKTVVVIAHRLSTIMNMDRIVVMEHGAIAAQGTHDQLLAQDGLYQKLWSIQAGGFLPDEGEEE